MNVTAFGFYLIVGAGFLLSYMLWHRSITRPNTKEVFNTMLAVSCMSLVKAFLFVLTGYTEILILYTLYEIIHLWVIGTVVRFCVKICYRSVNRRFSIVIRILAALDCVSLVANAFTGHLFKITMVDGTAQTAYTPLIITHQIILGIYLIYGIISVCEYINRVHRFYWTKYVITFAFCIWILVGDVILLSRGSHMYRVEFSYFAATLVAAVFVLAFKSVTLRAHEYSETLNAISGFVFMYDNLGVCVMASRAAINFFKIDPFRLNEADNVISGLIGEEIPEDVMKYSCNCKYIKDERKYYLKLDYKRLMDEKDRFAGKIFSFTDITEEHLKLLEQTRLARYDSFTMVYDREWLFDSIEKTIQDNPEEKYYVVGSDIRDFKVFNDVFGKDAGDSVIIHIADTLKRLYSEGKLVHFGRIYGDRFGMLVKQENFQEDDIVNGFMSIDNPFQEEYYHLNFHFGVYRTDMDAGLPVKSMFDRAYVALDSIKNEVNIRSYHYNEMMRDEKVWEQTIASNIKKAIKEGQLRIVVQPQVNKKEEVIGGEALVRWRHPVNGEISPGEFIPILEKTGLVTSTDLHVWEESCKLLRRWKDLGYDRYYISVNVSATDFMFADIYTIFTGLVEKYDVSPKKLKLEITETAMMTDVLERIVLIKRLEDAGFTVELDDFGSGYSSLNMLKEIPVDVIKMDMKFLYNYDDDENSNSKKVIGHIIHMAKDLNMEIVAEGVETEDQLHFLKDIGCDTFQGYYFSRPIEVRDFEEKQGIA